MASLATRWALRFWLALCPKSRVPGRRHGAVSGRRLHQKVINDIKDLLHGLSKHRRQSITFGHFLSTESNGLLYALRTVLLHAASLLPLYAVIAV